MTFDWNDYLQLALDLATQQGEVWHEARLRAAISRAYYAAFHAAGSYITNHFQLSIPEQSAHSFVAGQMQSPAINGIQLDKRAKKIGQDLWRLARLRKRADYEDIFSQIQVESSFALLLAESILQRLKDIT
jgi:uncharacterized protein (UPF0332 family)